MLTQKEQMDMHNEQVDRARSRDVTPDEPSPTVLLNRLCLEQRRCALASAKATAARDAMLASLNADGYSCQTLGMIAGLSHSSVHQRIWVHRDRELLSSRSPK